MRWPALLVVTVLCYGLAQGLYKQVPLETGHFCLLFVAVKTVLNWIPSAVLRPPPLLEPRARRFVGLALLGQLINGGAWITYFLALSRGPAALVGSITAAYTVIPVVVALVLLRERLAPRALVGVALIIAAAVLLGYGVGGGGAAQGGWLALSLVTLVLWGVATSLFKVAYNQEGAEDARFFVLNWIASLLTLLPYGLYEVSQSAGGPISAAVLLGGLAIVLLYGVGDLALFAALRRGPASLVSPLSGLYPIPTTVYAALVLHERLAPAHWAAVGLILAATVLLVPPSRSGGPQKEGTS